MTAKWLPYGIGLRSFSWDRSNIPVLIQSHCGELQLLNWFLFSSCFSHYTALVDVWSVGCIMGELFKGHAIFRGGEKNKTAERPYFYTGQVEPVIPVNPVPPHAYGIANCDVCKVEEMTKVLGSLTEDRWPLVTKCRQYKHIKDWKVAFFCPTTHNMGNFAPKEGRSERVVVYPTTAQNLT
jgi:hypothetical protein